MHSECNAKRSWANIRSCLLHTNSCLSLVIRTISIFSLPYNLVHYCTLTLCPPAVLINHTCHDTTGCGGNMVTGVNTVEECCLGSGLSFRNGSGVCRQCIGK